MYNIRHLARIAMEGVGDMGPAVRQAFNADPDDDRLDQVYGTPTRTRIMAIAVFSIVAGELIAGLFPGFPLSRFIHWPAAVLGLVFALLIRRYLFDGERVRDGVKEEDFPWLAASLAMPLGLLLLEFLISQVVARLGGKGLGFGDVLVMFVNELGVAAAMTVAVAALCFSSNWTRGLWNLAVRLLVFRIMVYVTTLILLEIGIVGPILSGILNSVFGIRIPEWIHQLADQLSYVGVMSVIYLAVIGATWTVCRRSFGELLEVGEVDILKTIEELSRDPKAREKKRKKREEKARKKAQKKTLKAADKNS